METPTLQQVCRFFYYEGQGFFIVKWKCVLFFEVTRELLAGVVNINNQFSNGDGGGNCGL